MLVILVKLLHGLIDEVLHLAPERCKEVVEDAAVRLSHDAPVRLLSRVHGAIDGLGRRRWRRRRRLGGRTWSLLRLCGQRCPRCRSERGGYTQRPAAADRRCLRLVPILVILCEPCGTERRGRAGRVAFRQELSAAHRQLQEAATLCREFAGGALEARVLEEELRPRAILLPEASLEACGGRCLSAPSAAVSARPGTGAAPMPSLQKAYATFALSEVEHGLRHQEILLALFVLGLIDLPQLLVVEILAFLLLLRLLGIRADLFHGPQRTCEHTCGVRDLLPQAGEIARHLLGGRQVLLPELMALDDLLIETLLRLQGHAVQRPNRLCHLLWGCRCGLLTTDRHAPVYKSHHGSRCLHLA
mmetsp:Transcript_81506/g.174651  ORF Transcript_81506/g.174651 Transcript_81506/m.174651 type:complete len:359 (+) Transcript_81506:1820-2896(+)